MRGSFCLLESMKDRIYRYCILLVVILLACSLGFIIPAIRAGAAPALTTVASDNFNRADGVVVGTSSGGGVWTVANGFASAISSNRVSVGTSSVINLPTSTVDVNACVTFINVVNGAQMNVRHTTGNTVAGIGARINAGVYNIYNGNSSLSTTAVSAVAGDRVCLKAEADVYTLVVNGTQIAQVTNSSYPTNTLVAFINFNNGTAWLGDDLQVDDLIVPTATPTNTPVPPTNTPTNTPVPPTNTPTETPVPPTNTPTSTPAPPTNTPTETPVPTAEAYTATPTETPIPTATPVGTELPAIAANSRLQVLITLFMSTLTVGCLVLVIVRRRQ
jgi:hypothetical protein